MTYGDGIIAVCRMTNIAAAGKKPVKGLEVLESFCFSYDTLGINRYYTALQANQQIETVVNIPGWRRYDAGKDIAIIADADGSIDGGDQYTVQMVQPMLDEDGLRMTRLSLERLGENYAVMS